jgi:hypothetical protein
MLIVMGLVIAQNPPQMGLVPDEAAVQELASASPIQRRGVDPGTPEDLPCGRCRYLHSQTGQLAVDPAVPPAWVFRGPASRALVMSQLPVSPGPAERRTAGVAQLG